MGSDGVQHLLIEYPNLSIFNRMDISCAGHAVKKTDFTKNTARADQSNDDGGSLGGIRNLERAFFYKVETMSLITGGDQFLTTFARQLFSKGQNRLFQLKIKQVAAIFF